MIRLALLFCLALLALAQTPIRHGEFRIVASSASENGPVHHLSGNVTMESDTMLLHADQVDYNADTAEIVAHGEVRIKLK